jgi:hypothetical protein
VNYPGVNQPGWWFSTTAATTTWYPQTNAASISPSQAVTPDEPKPPASNMEWLRQQVDEICGLAFEVC